MNGQQTSRRVRAGPELDAELLSFMSSMGTGHRFRISLDRSPSFFEALEVEGENADVVVALAQERGMTRIVGAGAMTEKRVYLNGSSADSWMGQLSSARIDPAWRGGMTLARCYQSLRTWHRERRARAYLTTILEDAEMARRSFESGKGGIPHYRHMGRLLTMSRAVGPRARTTNLRGATSTVEIVRARDEDVGTIVGFWRAHGPRRQFFPAYTQADLRDQGGLLRGLAVDDLLVARARDHGEIVGTLGLWDQSAFRRWRVHGLPRGLALAAPAINGLARLTGGLPLPGRGDALRQRIASAVCVIDDDPGVFLALIEEAIRSVAREGGAWLTLGLHESDPLLPRFLGLRPRNLVSHLYLVHWPEDREFADGIDPGRCPYVELGAL